MTQLATVITKIKRNRSLLQVSKNHLDSATRKIIYFAHIFSHINYCLVTWGNMLPQGSIARLQKEQDKCVKLINPTIKLTEVYSTYNIMTIKELIQLENCKLGYRVCNYDLPHKVLEAIEHDQHGKSLHKQHGYNTRNRKNLNVPRAFGQQYRSSLLVKGPSEFAKLPKNIQSLDSFAKFKSSTKKTYPSSSKLNVTP